MKIHLQKRIHVDKPINRYLHWPYQQYTFILILTSYHIPILKWEIIQRIQYINTISDKKTITKVMSVTRYCMYDTTNEAKLSIYNTLSEIRRLTYSKINETICSEMITIIISTTRKDSRCHRGKLKKDRQYNGKRRDRKINHIQNTT